MAATVEGWASLVAAVASLVTAVGVLLTNRKVGVLHREVKTGNGQTLGALADIAEGRAAQAIPVGDRTAAEQIHADMKVRSEKTADVEALHTDRKPTR